MKKVLFILGTAHCGSTLLSLILDGSPQCFAVGELSNLPTIYSKYSKEQIAFQKHLNFWILKFNEEERRQLALSLSNKRISARIPLKVEKFFREIVDDPIFQPYSMIASKTSAEVLIDSTKAIYWISNMLRLKELKKEFDVCLLHLVRDGRAVLNSYLRKRKRMTSEEVSNLWLERVTKNEGFYANFSQGDKIQIAYEELATNPQKITQEICNFLKINFDPEIIDYWQYEHHVLSGNRGTKSLIKKYKMETESKVKSQNISIKVDLSWQTELNKNDLETFYQIVGNRNKPYEWHG